jgi:hypothetical protein
MARSDDHSPGDARKPYSDIGGPQARHAQTHDVRREQVTNPKGPQPEDTSFADQMAQETTGDHGGHQGESVTAVDEKALHELLPDLDRDQLTRLSVLAPDTPLEQGGAYLDLNNLADGPFKAIAGHKTTSKDRIIAKRDTDFELWNQLAGPDDEPALERPEPSASPSE